LHHLFKEAPCWFLFTFRKRKRTWDSSRTTKETSFRTWWRWRWIIPTFSFSNFAYRRLAKFLLAICSLCLSLPAQHWALTEHFSRSFDRRKMSSSTCWEETQLSRSLPIPWFKNFYFRAWNVELISTLFWIRVEIIARYVWTILY
jgi:hypothetical protein